MGPQGGWMGLIGGRVDGLLFAGDTKAWESFQKIGVELGLGGLEDADFCLVHKRNYRGRDGRARASMQTYHDNLKRVAASRARRHPDAALSGLEL